MKKIILLFILLGLTKLYSQNDYAVINIYRPKMMLGSAVTHKINFNGKQVCEIDNGGHLEYKAFALTNVHITMDGKEDVKRKDGLKISLEKGKVYNFRLTPVFGKMKIEQIQDTISKEELKSKYFVSLNDIGIDNNSNIKSDSNWTKDKLIEHWKNNGISELEGVYEVVGGSIQYELAVIKQNDEYTIIYLAGANGSAWKVGDIKATLKKSASFGVFKTKWIMLNKSQNKDVLIIFKDSSFSAPSETDDTNINYLKTFPNYESNIKKKE